MQSGATFRSTLITYVIPLYVQQEVKRVSTWVIAYRGADRCEYQIKANATGVLTEQGAAMLVSEYLREQQSRKGETGQPATEHYNFQIIHIHQLPAGTETP